MAWVAIAISIGLSIYHYRSIRRWRQRNREQDRVMKKLVRYERLLARRSALIKVNESMVNEKLRAIEMVEAAQQPATPRSRRERTIH